MAKEKKPQKEELFKEFQHAIYVNTGLDILGLMLEEYFENKKAYRKFMKHLSKCSKEFYKAICVSGYELDKLCPKEKENE